MNGLQSKLNASEIAEREGFALRHFLQVTVILTHTHNRLYFCGFQAHSELRLQFV
jgi:hypothetical protein